MHNLGKFLIGAGLFLIILGIGFIVFSRFKVPFFGRFPGDILIQKKNFTFYFPIATSLILSVIVSLIFYAISRFK